MGWNLWRRSLDPRRQVVQDLWDFEGHDFEHPDLGNKEEVNNGTLPLSGGGGCILDFEMLGNSLWKPLKFHISASGDARIW